MRKLHFLRSIQKWNIKWKFICFPQINVGNKGTRAPAQFTQSLTCLSGHVLSLLDGVIDSVTLKWVAEQVGV